MAFGAHRSATNLQLSVGHGNHAAERAVHRPSSGADHIEQEAPRREASRYVAEFENLNLINQAEASRIDPSHLHQLAQRSHASGNRAGREHSAVVPERAVVLRLGNAVQALGGESASLDDAAASTLNL